MTAAEIERDDEQVVRPYQAKPPREFPPHLMFRHEMCPCGARIAAIPWLDIDGRIPDPSELAWRCVRIVLGLIPATDPGHEGSTAPALHWRHVRVLIDVEPGLIEKTEACACLLGRDHAAAKSALVRP